VPVNVVFETHSITVGRRPTWQLTASHTLTWVWNWCADSATNAALMGLAILEQQLHCTV
jgi:hypothetical protein